MPRRSEPTPSTTCNCRRPTRSSTPPATTRRRGRPPAGGSANFNGSANAASVGASAFNYLQLPAANPFINPVSNNGVVGPFPEDMTRRNAFRGPGFWNMDMGLYKRIRVNEKYSVQLRLEAFNVFNHSNLFIAP